VFSSAFSIDIAIAATTMGKRREVVRVRGILCVVLGEERNGVVSPLGRGGTFFDKFFFS
jgi:hypothetical protein